jgi:hypothetical protein
MPMDTADITGLRESYRAARTSLERITEENEREIGLVALRLEATALYRGLVTTAQGFADGDAAILKEYVGNLVGGEGAQQTVEWLDAQAKSLAKKTLSSLMNMLSTGVAVGFLATVFGVVAAVAGTLEAAGAALTGVLIGGGSLGFVLFRGIYFASQGGSRAWVQSWSWAESLGKEADAALAAARSQQERVWRAATAAPWRVESFTAKARSRAQLCVGIAWLLIAAAVVLVLIGAGGALSALSEQQTSSL